MVKTNIIPKESLDNLEHEYGLLKLIFHRNKNQHRVTTWWKHLNQLKRYLTKLISLIHSYNKIFNQTTKTKLLSIARHLYFKLCKSAYRSFNGIVALGQFITLGLTLIGILGKIYHELGMIDGIRDKENKKVRNEVGSLDKGDVVDRGFGYGDDVGEELGEELGEEVGTVEQIHNEVEKKRKSSNQELPKKKKKKENELGDLKVSKGLKTKEKISGKNNGKVDKLKKKKKKSAIDDIFG
ncbi:Ribonuclease MRP protein subunit [Wickerhamomyces ciferrii]|uniref:Ribonuclease MRP protein subunit n=1 Tax=Wickerhamomyces ciferrii (strain ATCC 14091 / BCRC 22168 / CBS 111 / JCM 3599 / NBRC 0793 / NRRL Y-1031 F-60-10) TaxID=1206466 RepID=K0KHP3_WICCF|nr:Ribonuclease MRP protein subunit [Wickerhamomyces ciferrii]CCH41692.1 Ribonuclease MRP protein subunit [Wickerhamomyces ciferrii]